MIRVGDRAKIVISKQLIDMQLIPLAARWGTVMSVATTNKKNPGAWIKLDVKFKDVLCWFVPIQSIRIPYSETEIEKKKRNNLINSTIL